MVTLLAKRKCKVVILLLSAIHIHPVVVSHAMVTVVYAVVHAVVYAVVHVVQSWSMFQSSPSCPLALTAAKIAAIAMKHLILLLSLTLLCGFRSFRGALAGRAGLQSILAAFAPSLF